MVSILLEKASDAALIVATDGDEPTLALLQENIHDNHSQVFHSKLYWSRDIEAFKVEFPDRFEIMLAADVIYEEDQVQPLIDTVSALLHQPDGRFLLAFARRNVPMDRVIIAAEQAGFVYEIIDDRVHVNEPIYSFRWR